jgi:hypothetical protein
MFTNYDTVNGHILHGNAPTTHQVIGEGPLDAAPAPGDRGQSYDGAGNNRGFYELGEVTPVALGGANFYCHGEEGPAALTTPVVVAEDGALDSHP